MRFRPKPCEVALRAATGPVELSPISIFDLLSFFQIVHGNRREVVEGVWNSPVAAIDLRTFPNQYQRSNKYPPNFPNYSRLPAIIAPAGRVWL